MRVRANRPSSRVTVAAGLLLIAGGACAPAWADDELLGIYVGGAVGPSQQNFDQHVFDVHGSPAGFKFDLGIRPLPVVAAEISYIEFGRGYAGANSADTNAVGVFALGYLPIPVIDVYGKLGLAESRTTAEGANFSFHSSEANVAYGAGVGAHWGNLGARLEYERYHVSHSNDMGMASIGVTWTFL